MTLVTAHLDVAGFTLYLRRCDLSERTRVQYTLFAKHILQACPDLTRAQFDTFLATRSGSSALLNKYIACMKKLVDWAGVPFPVETLKKFKETPKTRVTFTDEETRAFLSVPRGKWVEPYTHTLFTQFWTLCAYLGMRPGEVASLRSLHLDFTRGAVTIPHSKTGTGRVIKLPEFLIPSLQAYAQGKDWLFLGKAKGTPIDVRDWNIDFKRRLTQIQCTRPVTPYSFRHTLATNLLHNEASLFAVQDILGHTDPNTTRIYYHGNLKSQEKALSRDPRSVQFTGAKSLVKQIEEFIDGLNLELRPDVNYVKVAEAKRILWESLTDV